MGAEQLWHRRCPQVSAAAPFPTLCTAAGNKAALLAHPWLRVTCDSVALGRFPRGQAFPTRLAAGGEPRGVAHTVLEAMEKPLLPCTELRSLHKGPFSFPTALSSPASYYLSPANNVSRERPPRAAPPSWRFSVQPQPRPGLTAAKRRQGSSQFGSSRSEKEPFCFICRFSKRVSVGQREIQADGNPSTGPPELWRWGWHSLPSSGCSSTALPDTGASLPRPTAMRIVVVAVPKTWEFGPVRLDPAAQWSLPSANTVPTQTPTLVLPECSSMINAFKIFFSPPLPLFFFFFLEKTVPFGSAPPCAELLAQTLP